MGLAGGGAQDQGDPFPYQGGVWASALILPLPPASNTSLPAYYYFQSSKDHLMNLRAEVYVITTKESSSKVFLTILPVMLGSLLRHQ